MGCEHIPVPSFNFVPSLCPACGSRLEWKSHDLRCMNLACPGKACGSLYHWIKTVGQRDIMGAGDSLIAAIVSYYGWQNTEDIYRKSLPTEENCLGMLSMDGMGEAKLETVRQIVRNLTKVPMPLTGFLVGMGLKGISYKTAHSLESQTNLEECIKNNTPEILNVAQIKGLGEAALQTLNENWGRILTLYNLTERLHMQRTPLPAEAAAGPAKKKLKVCITGKANNGLTRSQFYEKYRGHIAESPVSSCQYLVCNAPSSSSKIKTAKAKGIKVVTEDELQKIIAFQG